METNMQTMTTETTMLSYPVSDTSVSTTKTSNYEAVRFNAMKHGILSRLAVLAHEDHAEFDDLLGALINEHRPNGITEQHLIEELATIIWRKRRVLVAEGALINRGLKAVVASSANGSISAAAPFERGLTGQEDDIRRAMFFSPGRLAEDQEDADSELSGLWKAQSIIRKGGANAYSKARRALRAESRSCWDDHIAKGAAQPDTATLETYLRDVLEPILAGMVKQVRCRPAIKAQVLGDGLQAKKLEPLNRYEVHLDRKFERTLAMLLKLKELRRG